MMKKSKQPNKYRSKFEAEVAEYYGDKVLYEPERISYIQPSVERIYLPDFVTTNGIYLETKGYWDASDRKKHILIREQYPDKRFIMIFQNSNVTLTKRSKTTYGEWCDQHGLEWYCWKFKKPTKNIKELLHASKTSSRNERGTAPLRRRVNQRRIGISG